MGNFDRVDPDFLEVVVMLGKELLRGIVLGGDNDGHVMENHGNTLLLPAEGKPVILANSTKAVFVPGERLKYHYLSGVDGVGFWYPVRFGYPMPGLTEIISVLQAVYMQRAEQE